MKIPRNAKRGDVFECPGFAGHCKLTYADCIRRHIKTHRNGTMAGHPCFPKCSICAYGAAVFRRFGKPPKTAWMLKIERNSLPFGQLDIFRGVYE